MLWENAERNKHKSNENPEAFEIHEHSALFRSWVFFLVVWSGHMLGCLENHFLAVDVISAVPLVPSTAS